MSRPRSARGTYLRAGATADGSLASGHRLRDRHAVTADQGERCTRRDSAPVSYAISRMSRSNDFCALYTGFVAPVRLSGDRYHSAVFSALPATPSFPHDRKRFRAWARLGPLCVLHGIGAGALASNSRAGRRDRCQSAGVEDIGRAGAPPDRKGGFARSRSTTLMGRPLCNEAMQASTAG